MNIYEKIMSLYPSLTAQDFLNVIELRNDSDGKGDYIARWSHPDYPQPTQAELDAI